MVTLGNFRKMGYVLMCHLVTLFLGYSSNLATGCFFEAKQVLQEADHEINFENGEKSVLTDFQLPHAAMHRKNGSFININGFCNSSYSK